MNVYIDFHAVVLDALAAHPTSNLFFLIDHAGMPGLYRKLSRSSVVWQSLFEGTNEDKQLVAAPILILAGSRGNSQMPRSLLEWIGINGTFTSTVSMLVSPLEIDSMRRRLGARLSVRLSEGMEALLRFFDPRVLESLIKILEAKQAGAFFSPAESWRYVDRAGRVREFKTNFDSQDYSCEPLVLNESQESALLEECGVDLVINILCNNFSRYFTKLPLSEHYHFVSRAVNSARSNGFDSVLEFTFYAAAILSHGQGVTEKPFWSNFLSAIRNQDFELVGTLARLDVAGVEEKS